MLLLKGLLQLVSDLLQSANLQKFPFPVVQEQIPINALLTKESELTCLYISGGLRLQSASS